jgi:hypothetical protein
MDITIIGAVMGSGLRWPYRRLCSPIFFPKQVLLFDKTFNDKNYSNTQGLKKITFTQSYSLRAFQEYQKCTQISYNFYF